MYLTHNCHHFLSGTSLIIVIFILDLLSYVLHVHNVNLTKNIIHKTPVTPEWRPYSVPTAFKKIAERRGARCANASNAVQTLWKRCAIA